MLTDEKVASIVTAGRTRLKMKIITYSKITATMLTTILDTVNSTGRIYWQPWFYGLIYFTPPAIGWIPHTRQCADCSPLAKPFLSIYRHCFSIFLSIVGTTCSILCLMVWKPKFLTQARELKLRIAVLLAPLKQKDQRRIRIYRSVNNNWLNNQNWLGLFFTHQIVIFSKEKSQ